MPYRKRREPPALLFYPPLRSIASLQAFARLLPREAFLAGLCPPAPTQLPYLTDLCPPAATRSPLVGPRSPAATRNPSCRPPFSAAIRMPPCRPLPACCHADAPLQALACLLPRSCSTFAGPRRQPTAQPHCPLHGPFGGNENSFDCENNINSKNTNISVG